MSGNDNLTLTVTLTSDAWQELADVAYAAQDDEPDKALVMLARSLADVFGPVSDPQVDDNFPAYCLGRMAEVIHDKARQAALTTAMNELPRAVLERLLPGSL